jgi:hypothetical protein
MGQRSIISTKQQQQQDTSVYEAIQQQEHKPNSKQKLIPFPDCPQLKCGLRVSDQEQENGNNILNVIYRCVNLRPGQYSDIFDRT